MKEITLHTFQDVLPDKLGSFPDLSSKESFDSELPSWLFNNLKRELLVASPLFVFTGWTQSWVVAGITMTLVSTYAVMNATRDLREGYLLYPPRVIEEENQEVEEEPEINLVALRLEVLKEVFEVYEIPANIFYTKTKGKVLDSFELQVKRGYDINKITNYGGNFSRDLGLPQGQDVSIIDNIGSGKAGMYIPKDNREWVTFNPTDPDWLKFCKTAELPMFFGEYVDGKPVFIDLAKLPHLLVGGETGSGKTETIICLITSLMLAKTNDQVKFTLIDPKKVDFTRFIGKPHVNGEPYTDMEVALKKLDMILVEMDTRQKQLAKAGCKNIKTYLEAGYDMSYHVIVMEEITVAKLNSTPIYDEFGEEVKGKTVGKEIEKTLVELIIQCRAVGIHIIIGAQRFDAKYFDSQLRDNVTSVIGMRVKHKSSSQMLVDNSECTKLLKYGDAFMMLSGWPSAVRCHGAMIK